MKKLFSIFLVGVFLTFAGCSNDSGGSSTTDPFGGGGGGGGGGTGNVTVTVDLATDNDGSVYFEFSPNPGATITQVVARCTAINVNETVPVTGGQVYTAANPLYIGPVTGLAAGQQWTFTLTGNVGSTSGAAFTANSNFTVQ
jgi:hypothetical protein